MKEGWKAAKTQCTQGDELHHRICHPEDMLPRRQDMSGEQPSGFKLEGWPSLDREGGWEEDKGHSREGGSVRKVMEAKHPRQQAILLPGLGL